MKKIVNKVDSTKSFQAVDACEILVGDKKNKVLVYVASIPKNLTVEEVYHKERQIEIESVSSDEVKKEKYFVWKLLLFAIQKLLGDREDRISFAKKESGKWACDRCEFSLSHSKGVVCVAVSSFPVGVDIEKVEKPKRDISRKILSNEELEKFESLEQKERDRFLISRWTNKESIFKMKDNKTYSFEELKSYGDDVFQKFIEVNGEEFSLSVCLKTHLYVDYQLITGEI